MLTIRTHEVGADWNCLRCGAPIPKLMRDDKVVELVIGARVGVITGLTSSPDSSYEIKNAQDDSDQPCLARRR